LLTVPTSPCGISASICPNETVPGHRERNQTKARIEADVSTSELTTLSIAVGSGVVIAWLKLRGEGAFVVVARC
jgi:hypothetical protein